jgi:hypothetical protein
MNMKNMMSRFVVLFLMLFFACPVGAMAATSPLRPAKPDYKVVPSVKAASTAAESCPPMQGIFLNRLDPSFYTGFAPRTQDPKQVYTFLGRGNQLRVTVTLSDAILNTYVDDLAMRYKVYKNLVTSGEMKLTQNMGFEKFEETILRSGALELAAQKSSLTPAAYRQAALQVMRILNPGRIFHIKIDFTKRVREWVKGLDGLQGHALTKEQKLDLVNDILPTRLHVSEISPAEDKLLRDIVLLNARYRTYQDHASWYQMYRAVERLFARVTQNIYPLRDKALDYYEFTAIYPVGTLFEMAKFDGVEMPLYPAPGRRVLHTHQRSNMVDHISVDGSYGFTPWIPYMHVGPKMHNAFHTLWFKIDTKAQANLVPDAWKGSAEGSRDGSPYRYLWLTSRGPMSHGCTHVDAGQLEEMRQIFPSREEDLAQVVTYRSRSDNFDVFDINGDGTPEVMGIKYFHVYTLKGKTPDKRRAEPERKAFYSWLYKKGYHYGSMDRVIFDKVVSAKFIGNKAVPGKAYTNIELFEADYVPETIQFYAVKPVEFIRELRRVATGYDPGLRSLELAQK